MSKKSTHGRLSLSPWGGPWHMWAVLQTSQGRTSEELTISHPLLRETCMSFHLTGRRWKVSGYFTFKLVQHNHPDRKIRASWIRLDIHRLFHCQPLIKHHQPVDQLGVVPFVDRRIVFRNFPLCCSMSIRACLASWISATKSFRPSRPLVWPFGRSCFCMTLCKVSKSCKFSNFFSYVLKEKHLVSPVSGEFDPALPFQLFKAAPQDKVNFFSHI